MLKRAAGVLAPESEASSGQRRRARGRANWALRCKFQVTKEMAGFLSFNVLDEYLARSDGEPDATPRQATLSIRQRLVEEEARWQREEQPERRKFRRTALEKSRERAREAIDGFSQEITETAEVVLVARCSNSGVEVALASGGDGQRWATLAEVGNGLRRMASLAGASAKSQGRMRRAKQRAAQQSKKFGVRLQGAENLGPLVPAKAELDEQVTMQMIDLCRRFVQEHRAKGCTKVFYVERLEGETFMRATLEDLQAVSCRRVQEAGRIEPPSLRLGCECKYCVAHRAIAQWKHNRAHKPLDITIRGALDRIQLTTQVAKVFQACRLTLRLCHV